jgi:hypothetical protein
VGLLIFTEGAVRLLSITILALNHPKKKIILAREFEVPSINKAER